MFPQEAYEFADNNPGCDTERYQEIACQDSGWACNFAKYISGANIEYCQEHTCKEPLWAYYFAREILEADIEYCYNLTSPGNKKRIEEFIFKKL